MDSLPAEPPGSKKRPDRVMGTVTQAGIMDYYSPPGGLQGYCTKPMTPNPKDPDGGKDRGQEEKAATEDEMVGWHH